VRRCSLALGTQARTLAARMDDTADSVAIDEIVDLKAGVRDLDELIDEQLAMLTLLKVVQSPFLDFVRAADLFQVAISNTESSDRAVARLSSLASDIQGQYDAHQQHKTNSPQWRSSQGPLPGTSGRVDGWTRADQPAIPQSVNRPGRRTTPPATRRARAPTGA